MFGKWHRGLNGCIDTPLEGQKTWFRISIGGWVIPPEKIDHILVVDDRTDDSQCIKTGTESRLDVASLFPNVREAHKGGFKGTIRLGEQEGPHTLSIFGVTPEGKNLLLGERTIFNVRSELLKPPEFFQLALTNRCNLSCAMCPAHSPETSWAGHGLSIDPLLLDKSLESLRYYSKNIKRVILSEFGEPFLYSDIFDVINEVHAICPHAKLSLTSNGTLLSEQLIKKIIDSPLTEIAISLDAGSEKTYGMIRTGGDFHQILRGIKKYIEIRNLSGKKKPEIHTNFVLMRSNIQELPDYVRVAIDLGVDHIQTVNPFGIFKGDRDEILYAMPKSAGIPPIENYENIIKEALQMTQKSGISFSVPSFYPSPPTTECLGKGRSLVSLGPSGDVFPCCRMAAKSPEKDAVIKPFGNIIESSICEIWNSESFIHHRESFFKGILPNKLCIQCPRYYNI
jgi:MoaA/NifB/PqqE/SkfB family radical SAM enzyme